MIYKLFISNMLLRVGRPCLVAILSMAFAVVEADAQLFSVHPPFDAALTDPVTRLKQKIENDEVRLDFEEPRGYLDSLLNELDVPTESQTLVFSKTSLQSALISPDTPRALYFNDDVYVGWVQNGLIEIASTDPRYGTVFYTLEQSADNSPVFEREGARCINCHLPERREIPVPRLMVMSVLPNEDGVPLGLSVELTTDQSAMGSRWGGWYVTGSEDEGVLMGNSVFGSGQAPEWDIRNPRPLKSASDRFDTSAYLSDRSDAAALLALTHQAQIHNLIGEVGYSVQQLAADDSRRPSENIDSKVGDIVEPLVRALFFVDATPLDTPVDGTSPFVQEFESAGPRDRQGRSLRQLDLETRLLRYPLSYMVYTQSFEQLPLAALDRIYDRFQDILRGNDPVFSHLSMAERTAVLEILRDTSRPFRDWEDARTP